MKPASDFTTPRRLIPPISRHFFPVEQPEPFVCTTGLKNGSRFPFIAHFFSSGLGGLGAFALFAEAAAGALTAGAAIFATGAPLAGAALTAAALACCVGSGLEACAAAFEAGALATATFAGTRAAFAPVAEVLTAGAGAFFATLGAASSVCRVKMNLPAGPGVN